MPAVPSIAFPFKGSDSTVYSGNTVPLDAGGAVPTSVADGSIATIGAKADAAYADATLAAAGSLVGLLKGAFGKLAGLLTFFNARLDTNNILKVVSYDSTGAAVSYGGSTDATKAALGTTATDTVVKATATSRSGSIAAGGTQQTLMAANASRRGFVIQNQSAGDLWVNGLGSAAPDSSSLRVGAGDSYATDAHHVGTGALSVYGATTGQAFYAREF